MKTWQQLLAQVTSVTEEPFGSWTREISSAILSMQDAPWFQAVGRSIPVPGAAVQVSSWEEALTIFEDKSDTYDGIGFLSAAKYSVVDALDEVPDRGEVITRAARLAEDVVDPYAAVVGSYASEFNADMASHLQKFNQLLFTEIVVQDRTTCTYFREQLAWYCAGHFPCGWVGTWPDGKHRVF
jgi:hypothetical protein